MQLFILLKWQNYLLNFFINSLLDNMLWGIAVDFRTPSGQTWQSKQLLWGMIMVQQVWYE